MWTHKIVVFSVFSVSKHVMAKLNIWILYCYLKPGPVFEILQYFIHLWDRLILSKSMLRRQKSWTCMSVFFVASQSPPPDIYCFSFPSLFFVSFFLFSLFFYFIEGNSYGYNKLSLWIGPKVCQNLSQAHALMWVCVFKWYFVVTPKLKIWSLSQNYKWQKYAKSTYSLSLYI